MRILAARRIGAMRRPRRTTPDGEGRVVIEAVSPEIDGGRSAIKRVVGDQVHVEADIFTDGHDVINAAVLSRLAGETEWRRDPMLFVDNDRWHGHFPLTRNARYEYTVEAWRDDFSSWLRGLEKKRKAGIAVHLETQEGVSSSSAPPRSPRAAMPPRSTASWRRSRPTSPARPPSFTACWSRRR